MKILDPKIATEKDEILKLMRETREERRRLLDSGKYNIHKIILEFPRMLELNGSLVKNKNVNTTFQYIVNFKIRKQSFVYKIKLPKF